MSPGNGSAGSGRIPEDLWGPQPELSDLVALLLECRSGKLVAPTVGAREDYNSLLCVAPVLPTLDLGDVCPLQDDKAAWPYLC